MIYAEISGNFGYQAYYMSKKSNIYEDSENLC